MLNYFIEEAKNELFRLKLAEAEISKTEANNDQYTN